MPPLPSLRPRVEGGAAWGARGKVVEVIGRRAV
jgi:hypothetical protein